jgi:hypothetical protein
MRNIKPYDRSVTGRKFRTVQRKNNIAIYSVVANFAATEIESEFATQSTIKESLTVQTEHI